MSTNIIGKPQDRVDGKLKVTGRAMYPGDRQIENLAYGYLLTSAVAKGSIQAMDTSVAERSPGVAAVYTPFQSAQVVPRTGTLGRSDERRNSAASAGPKDPELRPNHRSGRGGLLRTGARCGCAGADTICRQKIPWLRGRRGWNIRSRRNPWAARRQR